MGNILGVGLGTVVLLTVSATIKSNQSNLFATKADGQMRNSRARNMSTGRKGSFKTALTGTLRIRIKNNITKYN